MAELRKHRWDDMEREHLSDGLGGEWPFCLTLGVELPKGRRYR